VLHHNFAFEIETGGKSEIFVSRTRKTVNAAVFATAIRIDARLETDVRTLIAGDNRFCRIGKKFGWTRRFFICVRIVIDTVNIGDVAMQFFEPVRGAPRGAAAVDWLAALSRFLNYRPKLFASCYDISSHEHGTLSSHLKLAAHHRE